MSNYQDRRGLVDLDLMDLADVTLRQVSTSATPEQVDLVVELEAVSRVLAEHCRDVLQGKWGRWAEVADVLAKAARLCQRQVVIEVDDIGDAGSR